MKNKEATRKEVIDFIKKDFRNCPHDEVEKNIRKTLQYIHWLEGEIEIEKSDWQFTYTNWTLDLMYQLYELEEVRTQNP